MCWKWSIHLQRAFIGGHTEPLEQSALAAIPISVVDKERTTFLAYDKPACLTLRMQTSHSPPEPLRRLVP